MKDIVLVPLVLLVPLKTVFFDIKLTRAVINNAALNKRPNRFLEAENEGKSLDQFVKIFNFTHGNLKRIIS